MRTDGIVFFQPVLGDARVAGNFYLQMPLNNGEALSEDQFNDLVAFMLPY